MLITKDRNLDGVLFTEPSKLISTFQVYGLGRYGVLPVPKEIKGLTKNTIYWKEDYLPDKPIYLAFTKPNKEALPKLAKSLLEKLHNFKYFYVTPGLAGELLIQDDSIDFTIDDWISKEEVVSDYRKSLYPDISPLATERLLKLLMIFYHKEFSKKELKFISAVQKILIQNSEKKNVKEISKKALSLIKRKYISIKEVETHLPSANIFTKTLECLQGCSHEAYDISSDIYKISEDVKDANIKKLEDILS